MNAPDLTNTTKSFGVLPPASSKQVGRGRALPTGRAAIGALLVVISGIGFATALRRATAAPTTNYVVAAHAIEPGEIIEASDVRLVTMVLPPAVANGSFSSTAQIVGTVTVGPIGAGELVQLSSLQRGGVSLREMSFPIDAARALNGNISPGDRIDVVSTHEAKDTDLAAGGTVTETVLANVQVIKVSGGSLDATSGDTIVITVSLGTSEDPVPRSNDALTTPQNILAEAANNGKLFVVRANDARMIAEQARLNAEQSPTTVRTSTNTSTDPASGADEVVK